MEIIKLIPSIRLDIRYATAHNFTGKVVYPSDRCYVRKGTAQKLDAVQRELMGSTAIKDADCLEKNQPPIPW